ncbi:DUF1573 domain-containing protein [Pedobacter sp. L105]|uniref:DUF1573 domain-containing protein n=1 Tax=Pedobacter sp. L105 TaxID=1641871 RepID=UPI00131AA6D7|nr:DUF1573 domain-containing protein [Pedobacter sp. L105]
MRKYILLALTAALSVACHRPKAADQAGVKATNIAVSSADAPVMSFEQGMFNFGKIAQGDKVKHDFNFKNTGKTPLIITDATATCGCTTPDFPKQPIKPGESGIIKVVFNSTGKSGMQDKVITITSNGNPVTSELHLIGEVKEPTAL